MHALEPIVILNRSSEENEISEERRRAARGVRHLAEQNPALTRLPVPPILKALKRTADHNPETLEALQKILPEMEEDASSSPPPSPTKLPGERERKDHAA
jgi:hypothetical protein